MAAAFVKNNGAAQNATAAQSTLPIPVTSAPSAGSLIVCYANPAGGKVFASVADTKGNAWSIATTDPGGGTAAASLAWTLQNAGTLTLADTVTPTFTGSGANKAGGLSEFSGIATTTPVDAIGTPANGATTTPACAITTAAQPAELVLGVLAWVQGGGPTISAPSGGFTVAQEVDQVGGNSIRVALIYRVVTAAGAYAPGATLTAAPTGWDAIAASFKAAGAAPASTPGGWLGTGSRFCRPFGAGSGH